MRRRLLGLYLAAMILLLTGCWDKSELIEYGYVQAAAIDYVKEGELQLTTLFYRPGSSSEASGAEATSGKSFNIVTHGSTPLQAIEEIPIYFGRRAKWDHMRVLLIGEKLARKENIGEILDFFSRDHEPRGNIYILVTKGKADRYLNVKPFIEYTVAQQIRQMALVSHEYSAKSIHTPLLDLALQLGSQTGDAIIPYLIMDEESKQASVQGIGLLKNGKLLNQHLLPQENAALLILMNRYHSGFIKIPCDEGDNGEQNIFKIVELQSKFHTQIVDEQVKVIFNISFSGTISELQCTSLITGADNKRFKQQITKKIIKQLNETTKMLQSHKIDVIGVGEQIYRKNPALWKKWRKDWDRRFPEVQFQYNIQASILNTGMNIGEPFKKEAH